jgi:hypothetical protein
MSSEAVEKVVELKRRAIALKETGDVNSAMALLAEARDIEFKNASIEDLWHPLKLKQFAVVLKKKGDLDGARQALLKAKQIETEGAATTTTGGAPPAAQAPPATSNAASTGMAAAANIETRETQERQQVSASQKANSMENGSHMESSDSENKQARQSNIPEIHDNDDVHDDNNNEDDNDDAKDELKELMLLDQDGNGDSDDGPIEVSYTIDDMADQEMMTEFRLGGMPTPSQEEYQAKILECKRSALAFKQAGNTGRAMQELQKSKTLEQVRIALSHMNEGLGLRINEDVDGWIETLNDEESEMLGEFLNKKPNTTVGGGSSSNNLEHVLEELSGFMEDPALLMDAINMGMTVPSVEEVQTQVQEHKRIAMEHKQAGDIERAKAALIQSKKFAAHSFKLELIFQQMRVLQRQQNGLPLEQLEALAEDAERGMATRTTATKAQKKEPPQKAAPSIKSSQQLREEAIRLRDEKKIAEAAQVLKLYKEAVKREQDAADLRRRQEAVQELQNEMELAKEQIHIFEFYQRFVDPDTQQIANWNQYMANCAKVAKVIQLKGVETIQMDRKAGSLMCVKPLVAVEEHDFNAMVTDLVEFGSNSDPTDERLEIAILNVQNVEDNAHVKKAVREQKRDKITPFPTTIRVEVTVQFPPNEVDTEKSIELMYQSSTIKDPTNDGGCEAGAGESPPTSYEFNEPQYAALPRGNSPYGKMVRKRIERKRKIQLSVFQVAIPPPKKGGGWFWSSSKQQGDNDLPSPLLLGKVVLELQSLMNKTCLVAGKFPLVNGSGTKALGGTIQLGVRTGVRYASSEQGDLSTQVAPSRTELCPYEAVAFSLSQPATSAEV